MNPFLIAVFVIRLFGSTSANVTGLCWTNWVNRQVASEGSDVELLSTSELFVYGVCLRPYAVDVRRIDGQPLVAKLDCKHNGCQCVSEHQAPGVNCGDYEVRFLCPCAKLSTKYNTDASFLLCGQSPSWNISCPAGGAIRIRSAYRGVLWFSHCGLNRLGTYCHSNSDKRSLFPTLSKLCNGKASCHIKKEDIQSNDVSQCNHQQQLHVEIQCQRSCDYYGELKLTGSVFPSKDCMKKCHCLHDGRIVCHRLCPRLEFINCTTGGLARLALKPSADFKQCYCYHAYCMNANEGCYFNGEKRERGSQFVVDCKYDCSCLGYGQVKCTRLCPEDPDIRCPEGASKEVLQLDTAYGNCKCPLEICHLDYEDNSVFSDID